MDTRLEFKSALHGDTTAYRLSSEWAWNKRGNAPLSLYITAYQTYGDGMTQHSGDWTAQFSDLTDVAISLTQAITADPANPAWRQLSYIFHDTSPDLIAFALSIKYREDKAQWYNMTDRKLSSAESKRHDKRWTAVESWMDGQPAAALSILLNAQPHLDWFGKLCVADDLRNAANYPLWEELFKPVTELTGDWGQAFHALRAAARAMIALDYAARACQSALFNSTPKTEETAAIAA